MIDALADFHFLRPWWLLLAPLVVGLAWLEWRHHAPLRGWRKQIDPDLLRVLIVGSEQTPRILFRSSLLASVIAVTAMAGPTWKLEPNPFAADATPLLVLLKADASMASSDSHPSPMERAQLKIADLARARKGDPLGLIAYAGTAHLVLPPTRDTEIVAEMAAEVSPDVMPRSGDRLDLAIRSAASLLRELESGGSLLIVADAASFDPDSISEVANEGRLPPIQFLSLLADDSPGSVSIQAAAGALGATVESLSPDDRDIGSIVRRAALRNSAVAGGEMDRWQEAGYWLTPLVAAFVAASFRRKQSIPPGASR